MAIQLLSVVHRAICPTFIHDDPTRIAISLFGLAIGIIILWRVSVYFN